MTGLARVLDGGLFTVASVAAAATPPPASSVLQVATALQNKGFTLSHRRRLWIPFLMKRDVALTAEQFAKNFDQGDSRLQIASSSLAPVFVRNRKDLDAVDAFYLSGQLGALPQAGLADSLNALFLKGWHFEQKRGDIGPYGAWRMLTDGGSRGVQATGHGDVALRTEEDVHRLRCFTVDGSIKGLSHPVEAQALLALAQKKAELRAPQGHSETFTADTVYQQLFQGTEAGPEIWAGTRTIAAIPIDAAALSDPARLVADYDRAMADASHVATAFPSVAGAAWNELRKPIAAESLDQRIAWMSSLTGAAGTQAVQGYAAVRSNLRDGDRFEDQLASFREVRALTGPYTHDGAVDSWLKLRDHLDETAPGVDPAAARRALFLRIFAHHHDLETTRRIWTGLDGAGTKTERIDAYEKLLAMEQRSSDQALAGFSAIKGRLKAGETLDQGVEAYRRTRSRLGQYDFEGGRQAFEFVRDGLDAAIPGPFTRAQREQLYLSMLDVYHSHDTAVKTLHFLTGTPPRADAELPSRLDALFALTPVENGSYDSATTALKSIEKCRRSGEPLADTVHAYVELRQRVSKYDTEQGVKAFEHLRSDLGTTMAGLSTVAEKRAMYLRLLDVTHSHDGAMEHYKRLAGDTPGADLPLRLEAWSQLCTLENGYQENAYKALSAIDSVRRAGEPLAAAVAEFQRLRPKVQKYDVDDACKLFVFERKEIAAALPGPWSDAQRREMHEKLVDSLHTHAAARTWLDRLCGRDKNHAEAAPPADLPQRIDAFVALLPSEKGSPDNAWEAFEAVGAAAGLLDDNARDYIALRGRVQPYDVKEAVTLFTTLHHDLAPAQRDGFLKVQGVLRNVATSLETFKALTADPNEADARLDALVALCQHEKSGADWGRKALDVVTSHRAVGETLAQACSAYQTVRDACPPYDADGAIKAFAFGREKVESSQAGLYLNVVKGVGSGAPATWNTLEQAGGAGRFEERVRLLLAQPRDQWSSMIAAFGRVGTAIPAGVDRDRAGLALVPVAAMPSADAALRHLVKRLDDSADADRTERLEWMASVMVCAGGPDRFDEALRVVDAAGGAGTPAERRALLTALGTAGGKAGFAASLDLLRAMEKLAPQDFTAVAPLARGLVEAMRPDVAGAGAALSRLLEGRAAGLYGAVSLDVLLERFSELFATGGSVDRAMARLEQEARSGPLHIERQDDYVVIGGIRVPRQHAD